MQVILIRHGMTEGNEKKRYIGATDELLSEEGVRQAQAVAELPEVSRVFVTPLLRTRQTANILFPQAEQIIVDDLREMDFGIFEGRNAEEMADDPQYRAWVEGGCTAPCPGGEGWTEFSARVCRAFAQILLPLIQNGEETAAFVVHGGTIMAIMEAFARPRRDFYCYQLGNCRFYRCGVEHATTGETPSFILKEESGEQP